MNNFIKGHKLALLWCIYTMVKLRGLGLMFRMGRSYLKARLLGKSAPISILINLTNVCPKGCCYCDSWKQPPKHMPTDRVFKLLRELRDNGVSRITFHGGDPLMHPDFGRIVREARRLGFFITISVRETKVKERIDDLRYVDLVFVSFDGKEEAHDAHKGKGSFNDLMEAFELLSSRKINFQTTTVLTKKSQGDIDFILDTARKYNFQAHFQTLQFPLYRNNIEREQINDPNKNPLVPLMLTKKEYAEIGRKLLRLKDKGRNIATSKRIIKLIFLEWPDPKRTFLPYKLDRSIRCWSGLLYNSILVTGELIPCSYYFYADYPKNAPNVFKLGFKKALENSIKDNTCQSCQVPCFMELNAMFSLNLPTILNWAPKVFR